MTRTEFDLYKVQTDAEIAGLKDKVATQQKLINKLDGERIMKDTFLTDMKSKIDSLGDKILILRTQKETKIKTDHWRN